jgi:hypothetical protein
MTIARMPTPVASAEIPSEALPRRQDKIVFGHVNSLIVSTGSVRGSSFIRSKTFTLTDKQTSSKANGQASTWKNSTFFMYIGLFMTAVNLFEWIFSTFTDVINFAGAVCLLGIAVTKLLAHIRVTHQVPKTKFNSDLGPRSIFPT